ncbi:DNA translocase FtsK [Pseudomonas cavernicola]|uniref:DNA translocase FtsK n=1 Tax=Pseudomonas cavernicola TaxID=2320866 RepID=UPI003B75B8B1
MTEQRATVGWLQGVLAVTEEQAGVLLDLLEDQGVVGPANDLGGRSVLWATE